MKPLTENSRSCFAGPAITLFVVTFWLAGCGAKPENTATTASRLPVLAVKAQIAERQSYEATEDVVGTVRPKLSATLEAKVSGLIAKMLVVSGQSVKAGDLLVELDAHELQARCDQADAAMAQAAMDWKRASTLFEEQAATRAEYDAADARYRMAQAAAAEAKAMLGYLEIQAPFDGVITRKLADVGDLAGPGKPLLQMENPGAMRLEAAVPEALVGNLKMGDALSVRIAAMTNEIDGVVSEISPAADPDTRSCLVKLDLPSGEGLRAGQFGRVAVPAGEVAGIRIPLAAVVQRGQMEMVFVVENGRAQLRLVRLGERRGDEVEIVSGLDSGDNIVTDGAAALRDGEAVTLKP